MSVIDAHFHWFPRPYLERMCGRSGFPRAERAGSGYVYLYDGGKASLALPEVWVDLDRGLEEAASVSGEDTAVVCTAGVLSGILDQAPAAEAGDIAREHNEEMAAAERRYPGRFYGTATVPLQDEQVAIEVLDHAIKELGLHGVNLPSITNGELVDSPRLEPYYARVAELGVPLIIHPTDLVYGPYFGDAYGGALQLTLGRLLDASVTVLRLVLSGLLARHRDLRILQTHAGGLLPYQAGRIDKNGGGAKLPEPPSTYLKRLFVDTVAPQPLTIATAVAFFGADHVLYGTDYPCWSPKAALETIDAAGLADQERSLIYTSNARALLRLG
jgi:aminocarboxymuconate-semialdehyde decarboxylase